MGPSLFHRGFVGIPTDLSSDPSICGVGYATRKGASLSYSFSLGKKRISLILKKAEPGFFPLVKVLYNGGIQ
ncbi:hypothetical protein [Leptospira weilii]|uniref:hypothetical protein n=1 Tax=Leptospira TaxID=171 RepID=UPI0002BE1905|nr:hypothetical protein LEP1GSC051_2241 [Leptospira sp. P2653]